MKQIFAAAALASFLINAIMPHTSFAKDPTLKEKIVAIAAEGKTIPVFYVVYTWDGIKGEQTRPPSLISQDLFKQKAVPGGYSSVVDSLIETLNKGYGVTCFKSVAYESVPKKESKMFGTEPDWKAADYNLYVSVVINGTYASILGQSSNSIKFTMKCEIKIMENVEKKGEKKSETIKTLNATASTKAMPVKGAYSSWDEFVKDIPPETLIGELRDAAIKEVVKYSAK